MKQEVRKYKMSDAKLVQLAGNLKNSAVRDLENLEEHGVSTHSLNDLQYAIYNFSSKPTDEELSKHLLSVVQNKPVEKVALKRVNKPISERSQLYYGIGLPGQQGTNELMRKEKKFQSDSVAQLPELNMDGITHEMLNNLGCNNRYTYTQVDALQNRDMAVYDRIAAGNSLYAMMITLAAKGKQCWLDLSEKRYNDYIATENYINNWQCTDGQISPFMVVNLSVTSLTDATVFTLTNNSSVPLNFFFTQHPADILADSMVSIAPGASQSYTAAALGYNEGIQKTRLNVLNSNALPGAYLVEWV